MLLWNGGAWGPQACGILTRRSLSNLISNSLALALAPLPLILKRVHRPPPVDAKSMHGWLTRSCCAFPAAALAPSQSNHFDTYNCVAPWRKSCFVADRPEVQQLFVLKTDGMCGSFLRSPRIFISRLVRRWAWRLAGDHVHHRSSTTVNLTSEYRAKPNFPKRGKRCKPAAVGVVLVWDACNLVM